MAAGLVYLKQYIEGSTGGLRNIAYWSDDGTASGNLSLVIGSGGGGSGGSGGLTDAELRATAVPVLKGQQSVADCTITAAGSLSAAIDLGVYRLVGITLPATFEPTTLSFQSSYDGTTWNNVYDSTGAEKTITVGVSRRVILSPADFYGVRWVKIRGGTAAAPVVVAADRVAKLIAEA